MMLPSCLSRTVFLIGLIALLSASGCAAQEDSNGGAATAPAPPSAGTDSTGQTVDETNTIVATDETSTGSDI